MKSLKVSEPQLPDEPVYGTAITANADPFGCTDGKVTI
jgi:hypothetical protein